MPLAQTADDLRAGVPQLTQEQWLRLEAFRPPGGLVLGRVRNQAFAAYASGRRCPPVPDDERIFTPRAEQPAAMVVSTR